MDINIKKELSIEINKYMKEIQKKCEYILKSEIQKLVYEAYKPTYYADGQGSRTDQLINSVRSELRPDGTLFIYVNEGELNYYSAVDGSDQSKNVPFFVNYGHFDNTGIDNKYHSYEGRFFIESAAERIKKELGIEVEIINDRNSGHWGDYGRY